MDRRAFISTLTGGLIAAPLAMPARAQTKARRLAFLTPRSRPSPPGHDAFSQAFVQGMRELGYVEGTNLVVEWRYANGIYKSLPDLAAELTRADPEVIVAYGTAAAQALKKATSSIPIVVAAAVDLVGSGIVESLRRPGGNVTGLSAIGVDLSPKHLELLRTVMPRLASVAVLINPGNSTHPAVLKNVVASAEKFAALKVVSADARVPNDIEGAFTVASRKGAGAVIVATDAFYSGQGPRLADASLKHHLPTTSIYDENVQAGCLMSYGQDIAAFHRQAATYVDKILKGARPADLPVEQPTKSQDRQGHGPQDPPLAPAAGGSGDRIGRPPYASAPAPSMICAGAATLAVALAPLCLAAAMPILWTKTRSPAAKAAGSPMPDPAAGFPPSESLVGSQNLSPNNPTPKVDHHMTPDPPHASSVSRSGCGCSPSPGTSYPWAGVSRVEGRGAVLHQRAHRPSAGRGPRAC
jgi:putative ABC transport system substrate-binding protein